jgi:hydrophobe/amphiphile efflux-1 (HAE1) family protein
MTLSEISISRPVLSIVMSLVIVIFGLLGFRSLGVREYPNVDPPIVTVRTDYTGANADVMESQITEPLEESINGIAGIRSISSTSSDGRSTITVEFELGVDMEAAANDVRDRVSRSVRLLPPDADPPIVTKADASSDFILSISIQSPQRSLLELSDIANRIFKERIQTTNGVAEIRIWGEKKYAMKLLLDPLRMAAYGVTPQEIRNALVNENVELPSGLIEGYSTELSIRTLGRLETEKDFNELIIAERGGSTVRLRDIGRAELRPENERTLLRGNNLTPMVAVAVTPQPGANYIAVADEIYKRVEQIKLDLPQDIKVDYVWDTTLSIRKAIDEVQNTIVIAFLLVVFVIFLFLRDWRTTIIPVIAIPISLVGSFFVMYWLDYSINILTLLGVVLATGLVVDDAIVVLENIYSKIEEGLKPKIAGILGSKEIYFAVISTTLTLVAVFLPVIFLEGITGRLFREFGVVVSASVIISSFVSLTLTPMMSTKILKKREQQNWLYRKTESFFEGMSSVYKKYLTSFMARKRFSIVIMALCMAAIYFIGKELPSELAPMEDKSRLLINMRTPEGTSFDAMDDYMLQLLNWVDTLEEKSSLIAVTSPGFGASVSVNSAFIRTTLKQPELRKRSQSEIANEISGRLREYPFARAFVIQDQTIQLNRRGLPIDFVIQAPNFDKLKEKLPIFLEKAESDPVFQVVDVNLKFTKPELVISIDRDRARNLGVNVRDIAETLQLMYAGQRFGFFIKNNQQYQVIGQADRINRDEPLDLTKVVIRNREGEFIPLSNLITTSERSTPPQLYRFNRYVSATVSASPAPGKTLGQGIDQMKNISEEVLDDTFSTELTGQSKDFEESSNSLLFAFILALILVFLILAAQFESFIDPLIIMFTVPLAIAGAVVSLWYFDQTLNIFSQIGIIVLVGLVTKNGILIVEFANQRRIQGLDKVEAVIGAATQRLRPILMTTLASALGALPIALAIGSASTSRVPMGIVIIGGLLFSLFLTLLVIPALYVMMASDSKYREDEA